MNSETSRNCVGRSIQRNGWTRTPWLWRSSSILRRWSLPEELAQGEARAHALAVRHFSCDCRCRDRGSVAAGPHRPREVPRLLGICVVRICGFPLRSSQVGERVRDPAAAQAEDVLDLLQRADDRTVDISALGPRAATAAMMTAMPEVSTRRVWALEARVQAISGSVAGSKDSVLSGLRAWVSFHRRYLGSAGASA